MRFMRYSRPASQRPARTRLDARIATAAALCGFLLMVEESGPALIMRGLQAISFGGWWWIPYVAVLMVAALSSLAGTGRLLLLTQRRGISDAERREIKACLASVAVILFAALIVPPLLGR